MTLQAVRIHLHALRSHSLLAAIVAALSLALAPASHAQTTEVRDLDNPARQPFQVAVPAQKLASFGDLNTIQVTSVPLGKRLVIEHVSLRLAGPVSPSGAEPPFASAFVFVETTTGGVGAKHEVQLDDIDVRPDRRTFFVASQAIRAYADPGTPVLVRIAGRNGAPVPAGSEAILVHATVSGHFVDFTEARRP